MAALPAWRPNPDDSELLNLDGLVFRREKRQRLDPTATSSAANPPPDPALERKHRRERKKRALLKLRNKYLQEISRWELLSNTLKEVEQSAQVPSMELQEELYPATSFRGESTSEEQLPSDNTRRRVVNDLLSQLEAQEAIIRDVSILCDVAELVCSAQEDRLKQQLTNLPIWDPSPNELMAALGEQ